MIIQLQSRAGRGENGMVTIIFLALLAIMLILATAEIRSLAHLRNEEKYLEQRQIRQLNHSQTNEVATNLVTLR